jgi:hypothetical protein
MAPEGMIGLGPADSLPVLEEESDLLTNFDSKAVKSLIGEWLCDSRATLLIASNGISEFGIYHVFGSRFGIE